MLQHILALRQGRRLGDGLADKFQQMRLALDGAVDLRVAAGHIGAYGDEVFVGAVASQQLFALLHPAQVSGRHYVGHHPADGGFNVDGRVNTLFGQGP